MVSKARRHEQLYKYRWQQMQAVGLAFCAGEVLNVLDDTLPVDFILVIPTDATDPGGSDLKFK